MGMNSYVKLLRSKNDPEYQKKLKVLMACKEAGVDPPSEIDEYFGGYGKDCNSEHPLKIDFKPRKYEAEMQEGFEIDLGELPVGVKTIRFVNSY